MYNHSQIFTSMIFVIFMKINDQFFNCVHSSYITDMNDYNNVFQQAVVALP